jgi:aspartate/methionine/tyrosine aminotransferase
MRLSTRLKPLQSNVFADMDVAKAKARSLGRDIIDLSLGSSDLPTAPEIIQAITESLEDPSTHGYLLFNATQDFRHTVAGWYSRKYGVAVDPDTEVLPLIGSQEGTAHLPLAILEPGDIALLLDPGYPSHAGGVYLAGGDIYTLPLSADRNFLPDFSQIPADILQRSRMLVLNYPHNPTSAIAPIEFWQSAVAFCQQYDIVLVHDFPYGDIVFEDVRVPSVFEVDRDKSVAIEFFTLSKSYNMGGFRIGYAIGNRELILALRQIKSVVDFNQYRGILHGAIAALNSEPTKIAVTVNTFKQRRDVFIAALDRIGWQVDKPAATMYIWAKLPAPWQHKSMDFCTELVTQTGVAVSPGIGFGKSGEGYVRFALVHPPEVLELAVDRVGKFLQNLSI